MADDQLREHEGHDERERQDGSEDGDRPLSTAEDRDEPDDPGGEAGDEAERRASRTTLQARTRTMKPTASRTDHRPSDVVGRIAMRRAFLAGSR